MFTGKNQKKLPLVSVLMPVFNSRNFIEQAVNSILKQTYHNFEFIIINDASTDGTQEFLRQLKDRRIKLFFNSKHKGVTNSLNIALTKASGKYIARMDADDISYPTRLQEQVEFLSQHPNIGLVGSWARQINNLHQIVNEIKYPVDFKSIEQTLSYKNPFLHSSVMFKRELYIKYGGYDPKLDGAEDYDLWLRYIKHAQMLNLPKILIEYRTSTHSVSYVDLKKVLTATYKTRWKSIIKYKYPWWHIIYFIKTYISAIMPQFILRFVYKRLYNYQ